MKTAEQSVEAFYRGPGWQTANGVTEDARRWEDVRQSSADYVGACRRRVSDHLASGDRILDMASGPIQYDEYLEYSADYRERHCIDLSPQALEGAKARIGDHGVFWQGSFFDYPCDDDFFDAAISLHTIYHIDAARQEEAVRKLLRVTDGPVVIVYANPNSILSRIKRFFRRAPQTGDLYYHAHPIAWWSRFRDIADVKILPWRSFAANEMRAAIPSGRMGRFILALLFRLERSVPDFFVKHGRYPMIIMRKRQKSHRFD